MEWAERATDAETELHWLHMAQACLSLAVAVESDEPHDVWRGALHTDMTHEDALTRH